MNDIYLKSNTATAAFHAQSWSDWHGVMAAVPWTVWAVLKVFFHTCGISALKLINYTIQKEKP